MFSPFISVILSWGCAVTAFISSHWHLDPAPQEYAYLSLMWLASYFIDKEWS
jgi:hypothetical protein